MHVGGSSDDHSRGIKRLTYIALRPQRSTRAERQFSLPSDRSTVHASLAVSAVVRTD